jgi:hypothetical protein
MADEDYKGAALMTDAPPRAKVLLGDRGYRRLVPRRPDDTQDRRLHPVTQEPQGS